MKAFASGFAPGFVVGLDRLAYVLAAVSWQSPAKHLPIVNGTGEAYDEDEQETCPSLARTKGIVSPLCS
jgi:hypothetical protein